MYTWKEIEISELSKNRNNLDIQKMYKRGAITNGGRYRILELEVGNDHVEVLARLEPGFEEYLTFSRKDYDLIPEGLSVSA
ncbi:MAG: hypothetical protein GQ574_03150 [Crocinitomix sp.]|nr:hypothetical protein [Crocinitomix sp.]